MWVLDGTKGLPSCWVPFCKFVCETTAAGWGNVDGARLVMP